jgi:hypothetical protein
VILSITCEISICSTEGSNLKKRLLQAEDLHKLRRYSNLSERRRQPFLREEPVVKLAVLKRRTSPIKKPHHNKHPQFDLPGLRSSY